MNCDKCQNPAVAHLRYSDIRLCKNHFIGLTTDRIRKTINKNKFFERGDRVAVAVSGGKDSIVTLRELRDISKKRGIEIVGVTIDEGIADYRPESIDIAERTYKELGVDYTILTYKDRVGKPLDKIMEKPDISRACEYCGVFRRRLIEDGAREMGADKIATGHNLDDEAQSIFMNYIRSDFPRIARSGPKTANKEGFIPRVKPLCNIPEKEVGLYAILKGYEIHEDECPNAANAFRLNIRDHMNLIEDKYPGFKFGIYNSAENLRNILADVNIEKNTLKKCENCGQNTSGKICKFCELKAYANKE